MGDLDAALMEFLPAVDLEDEPERTDWQAGMRPRRSHEEAEQDWLDSTDALFADDKLLDALFGG